jgi:LmbE family N-acetylglucosaminyl deacetylase
MIGLSFENHPRSVVCLGAHPDDIEVGAAGLLASLAAGSSEATFMFAIATGDRGRRKEASESARSLLGDRVTIEFGGFTDGMLPYSHAADTKEFFRSVAAAADADLVIAPHLGDRHQDHRFIGEITHQLFRSQMILEYEIVKLEGDLGRPNIYHPMTVAAAEAKLEHLASHFPSQHSKPWYDRDAFISLLRIRGVESLAEDGFAEAFHADRATIS